MGVTAFGDRLALVAFVCDQFGAESVAELRERVADVQPGFGADGHSEFYHRLRTYDLSFDERRLREYDTNIAEYEERIRHDRAAAIEFRPFQYLALLLTERYLDWYFEDRSGLHAAFERFVETWNEAARSYEAELFRPQPAEMSKLAYWMATGSGKTFLLHANYWQFDRYSDWTLDNVLLLTPNEGLAKQHAAELATSGIAAERLTSDSRLEAVGTDADVVVVPIHKLREEEGETTVAAESLAGRNLVFVDEGHKGTSSGETWLRHRETVTRGGFVFEYSATFGQALNASDNLELVDEYAKSVVFDYSFRHFHEDGYGKEYDVLNVREELDAEQQAQYLTANLLSYFEQRLCFADHPDLMAEYNIEDPVWVFVGRTVSSSAGSAAFEEETSDVVRVLRFVHRFLSRPAEYEAVVDDVLFGDPVLLDGEGQPLFHDRFEYLRDRYDSAADLYADAIEHVFHADGPTGLRVVDLLDAEGEVGLRAGEDGPFFGVVNIGNTTAFLNRVESDAPAVETRQDRFTTSLFERLDRSDSSVHLLLGAKKFIEGWDNPRVASMGLLNVGRSEGSEIIQIFGRGIRLRGKDDDLRRSAARDEVAPPVLSVVETLRIFGVRADYVAEFRDYLRAEGIDPGYVSDEVPIDLDGDLAAAELRLPAQASTARFVDEVVVTVEGAPDGEAPEVDRYGRVETAGGEDGLVSAVARTERTIPPGTVAALDWDDLRDRLLAFKRREGYSNLVVTKAGLRAVLDEAHYHLYCPPEYVTFEDRDGYDRVMETAATVLRHYVERLYSDRRRAWEGERMHLTTLDETDPNVAFEAYDVRISERAPDAVFEGFEALLSNLDSVYDGSYDGAAAVPRVFNDRHLYQPLFAARDEVRFSPPALNEGEARFVTDLREYLAANAEAFADTSVYLLRNRSRKGVGFFESSNFYPDFVLWLVDADGAQQVVFVDPHGMVHAFGRLENPKVRLHERIKELEREFDAEDVSLESFVVSTTPWRTLRDVAPDVSREEWETNHVLFQEGEYLRTLFETIGAVDPATD